VEAAEHGMLKPFTQNTRGKREQLRLNVEAHWDRCETEKEEAENT
jgi:hypothetical protein